MKKIFTRSLIFLNLLIFEIQADPKKKILIITCNGGGGHMSACKALTDSLNDIYNIEVVNPLSEILHPIDPIKNITFHLYNAEELYNYFLQNHWNWMINKFGDFGKYYIRNHSRRIKKLLSQFIEQSKPDMIISVMPYINDSLLYICQENNIPFLIVPTDLDVSTFILGIDSPNYEKFKIAIAFDDPLLTKKIENNHITKDKIKITGYPLRSNFFDAEFNVDEIKSNFNIQNNKIIVMILMGATGSSAIYYYAKNLAKSKLDMHLIICLGKNQGIKKKIKKIKFPNNISISVIGYTTRAADLMHVSDILITKSGGASICEAIQMSLPVLVDNTSIPLTWEKMSCDFIKKHNLGKSIKYVKQINKFLEQLAKKETLEKIKKRMHEFKNQSFKNEIRLLVNDMFKK